MTGQVELLSSQTWLYPYQSPGHLKRTRFTSFGDRGSVLQAMLRWKSPGASWMPWGRRLGLFYFPFRNQPVVLGDAQELLWGRQRTGNLQDTAHQTGTWGALFHWDWFRAWLALDMTRLPRQVGAPTSIAALNTPALLGALHFAPWRGLRLWLQGQVFQGESVRVRLSNQSTIRDYGGGGFHGGFTFWLGDKASEIPFIHRRRNDPRIALGAMPPLSRPAGWGVALFGEFGMRLHSLFDVDKQGKSEKMVAGKALRVGARVRWGRWFQGSVGLLWRDLDWLMYPNAGRAHFSVPEKAKIQDLWQIFVATSFWLRRELILSLRVDMFRPLWYRGPDLFNPAKDAAYLYFPSGFALALRAGSSAPLWVGQGTAQLRWDTGPLTLAVEFWLYADNNGLQAMGRVGGAPTPPVLSRWAFGSELLMYVHF